MGEFRKYTLRDMIYFLLPLISIGFLIILWISVSSQDSALFPSIGATYERLLRLLERPIMRVSFWGHILDSLKRVLIALLAAIVLGVAFGTLIGWNKKCNAFFGAIFHFLRPIPPLAWIPLITIIFGIGEFPKVLIVFIGAVIPIVINTCAGLERVEQIYLDVGLLFDGNKQQILWEVAMPCAIPSIIAGVKTATSVGWMVVLAAEMLGARSGVGFLVTRGMYANDMPLVLVSMITIGIIGALLGVITTLIERLLCPWMKIK